MHFADLLAGFHNEITFQYHWMIYIKYRTILQ